MFLRRLASPISVLALPLILSLAGCSKLYSISILPASGSVVLTAVGQTAQFSAFGVSQQGSSNPTTDNITSSVAWGSSNPSVATINSSGVATAVGAGKTQITASKNGLVATSDVTVTLSSSSGGSGTPSITITPSTSNSTFIGETTQFIATGNLTGTGTSQNLTSQVTWASSNAQVATITSGGLATAVGAGTTTITASSGGTIGTAALTVTSGGTSVNATLAIIPTTATATFSGETTQFIALGNLAGVTATQDLTSNVTWSSSDVAVATIDKNGLATAVAANISIPETTTITAIGTTSTGSLITATALLTVQPAGGSVTLPALSIYLSGSGTGTVTSTTTSGGTTISCGSGGTGTTCTANFSRFAIVTLTAAPNGHFGGWSSNCVPVVGNPLSCTIQMSNNETVGAVFNP